MTTANEETMPVEGTVMDGSRGQYHVETADGVLLCTLRGKLRKDLYYADSANFRHKARRAVTKARDPVSVGDRVRVVLMGDGKGMIEEVVGVAPGFSREDSGGKGEIRSVAGIDQVVAVFAARDPAPHLGLLDRFLVMAEAQDLPAIICLNKVDLGVDPDLAAMLDVYADLGYPVMRTSVADEIGLDELRVRLASHTSALLGPSGVGKSSLLNALEPGLGLRVNGVSELTHKGRHTTSGTRMVHLSGPGGGALADTAGIRAFAMGGAAGRLDECFPEFRPYLGTCRHDDCSHSNEPGCAVRAALATGRISAARYDSYCRLYEEGAGKIGRHWIDGVSNRSLVGPGEFRM
ncbi:MAG: ribosome small subunit-dependent GTPase A [Chloroflexia bacterium]